MPATGVDETMTTPQITALPPAPTPQDSPEAFNDKAFRVLAAQEAFVEEANELAEFVNQKTSDAAAASVSAGQAAQSAEVARDDAIAAKNVVVGVASQFGDVGSAIAVAEDAAQRSFTQAQVATNASQVAELARDAATVAKNAAVAAEQSIDSRAEQITTDATLAAVGAVTTQVESARDVAVAAKDGAELARDAAVAAAGPLYATVEEGRASVEDGDDFRVQGSGNVAVDVFRRVSEASSVKIASIPATSYVEETAKTANSAYYAADAAALQIESQSDEVGGGVMTEAGDLTWLQWNKIDGGPTGVVRSYLKNALDFTDQIKREESIGGGIVVADGDLTWLQWNEVDGGPTQAAVRALRSAFDGVANYRIHPHDRLLVRDGADLQKWAVWGSSSAWYLAPLIATDVAANYGATVYNGGVSGQGVETIAARLGSRPAKITFPGNVIPATGSVEVNASNVSFYRYTNYFGTVAGVHGRLQRSGEGQPLFFTRSDAGDEVAVKEDEFFIPDAGVENRNSFTLLWMGKNDVSQSANTSTVINKVVEYTDEAFDYLAPLHVRALVLGHFVNRGTSSQAVKDQIKGINHAHAQRYGELFIDVHGWITSAQVWSDTGITPTEQDLIDQANGNIPISLARDDAHLTDFGYQAIYKHLITPRINSLSWY